MLLDEAQRRPHALDFLNPRRQARASRIDRRLVLAAATAAAVLLSGGLWIYLQLSWMTDDIAMNRNKHGSPAAKKELERAGKAVKDAAAIGEWAERDAVWLDELRELSVEFPPAEKAMLSEDDALSFSSHARGAALRFKALLDGQQTGRQIGDKLRDEGHVFAIDRQGERKDGKHYGLYGWELDGSILVLSPEEQTSRKQQAPRPAATPAGGTTP